MIRDSFGERLGGVTWYQAAFVAATRTPLASVQMLYRYGVRARTVLAAVLLVAGAFVQAGATYVGLPAVGAVAPAVCWLPGFLVVLWGLRRA